MSTKKFAQGIDSRRMVYFSMKFGWGQDVSMKSWCLIARGRDLMVGKVSAVGVLR